jgi:hypothetical protein
MYVPRLVMEPDVLACALFKTEYKHILFVECLRRVAVQSGSAERHEL